MDELFLGVDVGSSRAKAVLARRDGTVVAAAERPQEIARPRPGRAEQDPERDWWDSFVALCRTVLGGRHEDRVAAVGAAALGPCLAPGDADGRPLRPAILYGIDTRAEREIEELTERYGAETILARCGSPLSTQSVGPKLAWLARHDEVWPAVRTFFTAGSYLVHRLTGEYVLDHHSASQCGPLYDVHQNAWIEEWAAELAPRLRLPRLAWAHEVLGRVSAEAAAATGLPEGTPVAGGTIDSWAEVTASGLRSPGEGLLVYGTTLFLIEVDTPAHPDARLWSTTGFRPDSRNLAAGTGSAGALVAWLRQIAGGPPLERLEDEAAAAGAGAGGLVALPYFAGERTPLFDPEARGLLLGLTVSHTRGHVLRALLEGTAFARTPQPRGDA